MTEEVKPVEQPAEPVQPAPATETPAPAEQKPEAKQEQQPAFVTREMLEQEILRAKREIKQADKQRAKQIKQEMDTMKQRLEAAGIQVTPEAEQKLYSQVVDNLKDEDEAQPTGNAQDADPPPEWKPAFALMDKTGVYIEEADPEYKQFLDPLFNNKNAQDFEITLAMGKAIDAKNARTLQQKEKAPLRAPTGGGEGPGQFVAKSAKDYRQAVRQERINKS